MDVTRPCWALWGDGEGRGTVDQGGKPGPRDQKGKGLTRGAGNQMAGLYREEGQPISSPGEFRVRGICQTGRGRGMLGEPGAQCPLCC